MNKIINMYYAEFESFRGVWFFKNPLFVCFIFFLILFIFSILNLFDILGLHDNFIFFKKYDTYIVFLMEIFTVMLFKGLEEQRDNFLIKKYKKESEQNLTLAQIKRKWFKDTIDLPFSDYAALAEKVDRYYILEEKYSKPSLSRNQIMEYIFSVDSKNRILAMFMGAVALFTALNIANGANVENLYAFLNTLDFPNTILAIFFISFFILLFIYMAKYMVLMLFSLMDFFFDNTRKMNKISKRKKGIFIAELLKYYELPKKRHRVYFDL